MQNAPNRKLNQLNALIEMSALINSALDSVSISKKAIEAATQLLDAEAGSLLLLDHKTGELFFEVAVGEKGDEIRSIRLGKGLGIAGCVAANGEPLIVNDVTSDPRFYKGIDEVSGFRTKRIICVPVKAKDRMLGVLQVINREAEEFDYEDMIILYALANQVGVAIENSRLYQESITDGLTGLYHHKYFDVRLKEEVDRSKRYKIPLSLIFIDIDFFKRVNDTYGHLAGDGVLKGIASALKEGTRLSDIVARYGGEEFAVILPYISGENAIIVSERFRRVVEESSFEGIGVTISVGLGFFDGMDKSFDSKMMIKLADRALYTAKNKGRNRVEVLLHERR